VASRAAAEVSRRIVSSNENAGFSFLIGGRHSFNSSE
jgi:hypothetical protein